jgi:hypothetical protein
MDFRRQKVLGYDGQAPIGNRGNGSCQVGLQFPVLKQKSEERAERRDHHLRRFAAHGVGIPQNKIRNIV